MSANRDAYYENLRDQQRWALNRPGFKPGDGSAEMLKFIEWELDRVGITRDDQAERYLRWLSGCDIDTIATLLDLMTQNRPTAPQ
jgi:hypothetical protein